MSLFSSFHFLGKGCVSKEGCLEPTLARLCKEHMEKETERNL